MQPEGRSNKERGHARLPNLRDCAARSSYSLLHSLSMQNLNSAALSHGQEGSMPPLFSVRISKGLTALVVSALLLESFQALNHIRHFRLFSERFFDVR
jgi:hypothetical protein